MVCSEVSVATWFKAGPSFAAEWFFRRRPASDLPSALRSIAHRKELVTPINLLCGRPLESKGRKDEVRNKPPWKHLTPLEWFSATLMTQPLLHLTRSVVTELLESNLVAQPPAALAYLHPANEVCSAGL